jgi:alkylhydroperoxidase family enzyme
MNHSVPRAISEREPGISASLNAVIDTCWETLDPADVELIRLRVAAIHGHTVERTERATAFGLDERRVAAVATWWKSDVFSARERALLGFVEQFVFAVDSMTDELVDDLLATDDPIRVHELSNAVWAFDLITRLDMVAEQVL